MKSNWSKLSKADSTQVGQQEQHRIHLDLELIQGSLMGNKNSTDRLMERLECVSPILSAKNARMGRPFDRAELDDVIQECLIHVWRMRERFTGLGPLEAWCYRFTTLEFMNLLRKKKRRVLRVAPTAELEAADAGAGDPSRADDFEAIHLGLEDMGPPDADIVRLKHFDSLTFEQIGKRLGISSNTAKTQYYRGLSKLRTKLGNHYFADSVTRGGHSQ